MTCLVGIAMEDGRALVAADSRITWTLGAGRQVQEDSLQKLYGAGPDVLFAVCGDLRPAQRLLKASQRALDHQAKQPIPRSRWLSPRFLAALLHSRWESMALSGHVDLLVGLGGPGEVHLTRWSSRWKRQDGIRALWRVEEVTGGSVVVLGSIRDDSALRLRLENKVAFICKQTGRSDSVLAALLADKLTTFFQGDIAARVHVGGLFQIATYSENEFVMRGYDGHAYDGNGTIYDVSIHWDAATSRWIQEDHHAGTTAPLRRVDEVDFARPSPLRVVMDYGSALLGGR